MKRLICVLALMVLAVPARSANKITVATLTEMLNTMAADKKSDDEIAAALKQVELSEQLTRATMNQLAASAPGPHIMEQLYVLEAASAILPPPPADIPPTPAPDAAAQKAILLKVATYITKTQDQLPQLIATKTILRFQDNVEAAASADRKGGGRNTSGFSDPYQFIHYINSIESPYTSNHGIEQFPQDKTAWGSNGMIALEAPEPSLGEAFQDAQNAGSITWLRWENIGGKPAAVFSFKTEKKKTHFNTNICCFPEVTQAGVGFGNFQTAADWHNFKATGIPYHGELFVDPDTGIVVRLITQAEFKPGEIVHQQDTRVDYAPVNVGQATPVLPARAIILTEVAPNGDSPSAGTYTTRHTLFTIEYKDYREAFSNSH
jgi:hypothetical protein